MSRADRAPARLTLHPGRAIIPLNRGVGQESWKGTNVSEPRAGLLGAFVAALLAAALWTGTFGAEAPRPPEPPAPEPRVELPLPPMPPLAAPAPPPADPDPALYRAPATMAEGYLLTLVAEPAPPILKSGKPTTIKPRPHDVVQAPGDPKPIEGTITDEREGKVWFRDVKGIAHPKNPLAIADLVLFLRQAPTPQMIVRERSEKAGKQADAHLALAQDCLDGDLAAEAEAELKRALELEPRNLAARMKLADLYLSQGRRDAEVGLYLAAIAAQADSPEIRERLGQRCLEMGLLALAAEHFAQGSQLAAKGADAAAARRLARREAEARLLGGRAAEATALLDRLAKDAPGDPAVGSDRALADLLAGRFEPALATLRKVAEAADPPASARNNLGALLFRAGEHEAALAQFEACRRAAPHHTKATANAALACAALGRLDEAQKLLAAIAQPPANSLGYHLAAGYVQERLDKPDAALAAYQQARKLDPGCLYAASGVARCQLLRGDPQAAAEAFEEALVLAPADPELLRGLGTCHYRAGKFAAAAEVFRTLAARAGATPHDLLRLGMALLHSPGGRKEAGELSEKALAASRPPSPYALAAAAYIAYADGATEQAEERLRQAQRAPDAPEAAKYAAAALARLAAARGEEITRIAFGAAGPGKLPDGWRAVGEGTPAPEVRHDELRFEGQATATNERSAVAALPLARPDEKGVALRLARFEAATHVPLTNDAAVGVLMGVGQSTLQVAVRTTRQPLPSRRLAYRIVRGPTPTAWADLPGTIALERMRLGLGISRRAAEAVDIHLNGRVVGEPIPFDALKDPPQEITLGVFAATEPQQQCLFVVREIELVWKKP